MADKKLVIIADDGVPFDGTTPLKRPLGGAESAVVNLAEALAVQGHSVLVFNKCEKPVEHNGVQYKQIDKGLPDYADLYIANRGDKLLTKVKHAAHTVFWVHNPAQYLLKWRYLWKLFLRRPDIVFVGKYHATTCPDWVPSGVRKVIPLGVPDMFCTAPAHDKAPKPKVLFTSNPLRGLSWLLDVWKDKIAPHVAGAELHVFSGPSTYSLKGRLADEMNAVLQKVDELADCGVVRRDPVPKDALFGELKTARAMLYEGSMDETFCLALAEAQATGVPCVVKPVGSVVERIEDGKTGYITDDDSVFAQKAIHLLTNDDLWYDIHKNCQTMQRTWRWPDAAHAFIQLCKEKQTR